MEGKFVEIVTGQHRISVEIPAALAEKLSMRVPTGLSFRLNSGVSDAISTLLRSLLPSEDRTPSPAQLRFAESIASMIGLSLSESVKSSAEECSRFIDKNRVAFETVKAQWAELRKYMNAIAAKVTNIVRWSRAQEMSNAGEALEAIAADLGVTTTTVNKYIQQLYAWFEEDKTTDENKIVVAVLPRVRGGESAYAVVREIVEAYVEPPTCS